VTTWLKNQCNRRSLSPLLTMAAGHGGKLHILVKRETYATCRGCPLVSSGCSIDMCELQHYEVADMEWARREREQADKR
jgi:hypothetical protein